MELCPMCGGDVHERDAFCSRCGAPLREDSPERSVFERELARPRDGAGTQTWGVLLSIGFVLSALGAFFSLVIIVWLWRWSKLGAIVIGVLSFLWDIALAALFDAVIDLRKKARPSWRRPPPREETP